MKILGSPEQASLIQEQAAICASYARVMEYSGLFESRQGELWRERRFFAGAMLRVHRRDGGHPAHQCRY